MARKKVPDSVAQKSHRLLMRWYGEHQKHENGLRGNSLSAHIAMWNHCRRIAKGGRK